MVLSAKMRAELGMTVAVWYPESMASQVQLRLLRRTLEDVELFVRPANVCLVVDGCPQAIEPARQAAEEVASRCGEAPLVHIEEENRGQGGAVARGLELLLEKRDVAYLCTRDSDGDHDIYDLPQLFRRQVEVEAECGGQRVFSTGVRADLHRPMGYARGELEEVLNEVTVQALTATGAVPRLAYCRVYGHYPDFQSGYKLHGRWSAQETVSSLREADAAEPGERVLRWGVQFIPTVEMLRQGAVPAVVYRLTYDQQPQSSFEGHGDLPRAYGCQLAWLLRRLHLEPGRAWAMLDAALAAVMLCTTPGGWDTLLTLREYVAHHAFGTQAPPAPLRGAMF